MKLATASTPAGRRAIRVGQEAAIDLGMPDLDALLKSPDWPSRARTRGPVYDLTDVTLLAPITTPAKIFCVGLNYRTHILEMGRELPAYPTLFAKYPEALVGPTDPITRPDASTALDWEAELAVIIGRRVRHATTDQAAQAIAGYSVLNDITARDWQYRTPQWLQGKTFEATTPVGPVLVTPDEIPGGLTPHAQLTCHVNDEQVQQADTVDLVHTPADLVAYISSIITLNPGDIIATGTPGGVGHARTPRRYLDPGDTIRTEITGIGVLHNTVIQEKP